MTTGDGGDTGECGVSIHTLYVRVWIETELSEALIRASLVTLYVRVWIETTTLGQYGKRIIVTLYVRV